MSVPFRKRDYRLRRSGDGNISGPAQLGAYMARAGYDGSQAPTVDTLFALHRAHLTAIPYENLGIHFDER